MRYHLEYLGFLIFIPLFFKYYYIVKLEKIHRTFNFSRFWGRIYMAAFPIVKQPRNEDEKFLIKKANIATAWFWATFFIIIVLILFLNLL